MTLDQLLALNAYVVAGFVDFYDADQSAHVRLGTLLDDGTIVLTPEGEAFEAKHTPAPTPAPAPSQEPVT